MAKKLTADIIYVPQQIMRKYEVASVETKDKKSCGATQSLSGAYIAFDWLHREYFTRTMPIHPLCIKVNWWRDCLDTVLWCHEVWRGVRHTDEKAPCFTYQSTLYI